MEPNAWAHVLLCCSVTAQWSGIKDLASLIQILSTSTSQRVGPGGPWIDAQNHVGTSS